MGLGGSRTFMKKMKIFLLAPLLFLVIHSASIDADLSPVISTKTGLIRGSLIHSDPSIDRDVYEFIGIPFAEPPIGRLRFQKPVPKKPWADVFDATRRSKACIQFDGEPPGPQQSEDCLIVNIYVPRNAIDTPSRLLPVYVYMHGGSYIVGSAKQFDGTVFSAFNNVIVASLQYRLGPLGLAYFGETTDASGNIALWDQLEALKWISENIGFFGGSRREITLGGQSAGSISVSYHLLSPYSRGYFKRAVLESGTALLSQMLQQPNENIDVTDTLVEKVASSSSNCGSVTKQSPIADKLRCLRSTDVSVLVNVVGSHPASEVTPIIDGEFLPRHPVEMLQAGDFHNVPLLIGFNHDEGSVFLLDPQIAPLLDSGISLTVGHYSLLFENIYRQAADITKQNDAATLAAAKRHYLPVQMNRQSVIDALIQFTGDMAFVCPTYTWAKYAASHEIPAYVYRFTQRPNDDETNWMGSYHTLELDYVFGMPISLKDGYFNRFGQRINFTINDVALSRAMMRYWGNFIKTGHPGEVAVLGCNNTNGQMRKWPAFEGLRCRDQIVELNVKTQAEACRDAVTCHQKANDCLFWQDNFLVK